MSEFNQHFNEKNNGIGILGLGYVGMPLAISFSKVTDVIGFDPNREKVQLYQSGIDPTNEVGNDAIKKSSMKFTNDETELKNVSFYIAAVPTPINSDKTPDLNPVINVSKTIGKYLRKGSIVVYESTVYPGVTEDICVPILEEVSGLKLGTDFKVGYSPERINPGDKENRLENIVKIVSGSDQEALEIISQVYSTIIKAGIHRAPTIKVAEAAKVVENSQRDINIAFMNELSMVFNKMNINTYDVIEAMNTKWNALKFTPGLVGGHCIGVDPYYFLYEAEKIGYHSQIIASGRKVNDGMSRFVVEQIIKELIKLDISIKRANIGILGLTFKENTPDIRNSKMFDIVNELKGYGVVPQISDLYANEEEINKISDSEFVDYETFKDLDCLIIGVAHDEYKKLTNYDFNRIRGNKKKLLIIDLKGIFPSTRFESENFSYWSL
ncbi:nucleotide sugar dehydrogenase [Exiguobacterium sp. s194]|uniref:nucleotide sugar dehydrogenase n=1 Tax=Exiguobacterium sp. s194 TaxID=2751230 RepID=UPI00333A4F33